MTITSFSAITTDSTKPTLLSIDNCRSFVGDNQADIVFNHAIVAFRDLTPHPTDRGYPTTDITRWSLAGDQLTFFAGDAVVSRLTFHDQSPEAANGSNLHIGRVAGNTGLYLTEGNAYGPSSPDTIPGTVTAATPPPSASPLIVAQNTATGTDIADTSSTYHGPVAGIVSEFSAITPDSINVTALADSMFIKTGSGNDAIAVHGGTNVVDAGSGSNFLTGGSGFDTFFADARNVPAASSAAGPVPGAIWDTIEQFTSGDAVTLWGVGRAAPLSWQSNQGAVGHTGLTMHANKANGTEVSLTFAGLDTRAGVSLSYGQSGGVDYLYLKAV